MAWELATFSADLLELDPAEIEALAATEDALTGLEVDVVGPGEGVRVTHVLDALEPRVRVREGRTNRLDGVVVLSCLDFPGEERPLHEQEAIVDLAGPAADLTPLAGLVNVVLTFRAREGAGHVALDEAARRVTLAVAELLARPTLAAEPIAVERFELGPADESLPAVAALIQLSDLGQLYTQWIDGVAAGRRGFRAPSRPSSCSTRTSSAASTTGRHSGTRRSSSSRTRSSARSFVSTGHACAWPESCSCAAMSRRPRTRNAPRSGSPSWPASSAPTARSSRRTPAATRTRT
jgi:hypothetical protein